MTIFTGGFANDTFIGGSGNDSISGGGGNDSLNGGAGDDTIYGGIGNDTIYGGAGNDFLSGDVGVDSIVGGAGDDIYVHYMGGGVDYINDNKDGSGNGIDTIWFPNVALSSLIFVWSDLNLNLNITTAADWNYDGKVDDGVVIQNQGAGGNYKIELIAGSDSVLYYL